MFWGNWNPAAASAAAVAAHAALSVPTQDSLEYREKRAAEKAIDDAGVGTCQHCDEEIMKNAAEIWESEFLLAYCTVAKDAKHRPLVRYVPSEGVVNAKRNSETHSEPVSDERTGS